VFTLDVDFLSVNGDYVFSLQVGELTRSITVRVVDPTPKVEFTVKTNATNTVDAATNNFFTKGTDGKFYATLPQVGTSQVTADFTLLLKNMKPDSDSKVTYSIERVLPTTSDIRSDKISVNNAFGNDGHLVGAQTTASGDAILSLLDGLGISSTVSNHTTTPSNNLDSYARLTFTAKGTYVYKLTIEGITTIVELVVQPFANLKVNGAAIGTTQLGKFVGDGLFMIEDKATAQTVTFAVEGDSLPAGTYFYKVFDFASGTAFFDNATPTAITSGGLVVAGTEELEELDFAVGVDVVYAANAVAAVGNSAKFKKVVGIYKLVPARFVLSAGAYSSTQAARYELVGHEVIEIWVVELIAD
jgi:hypothetical protein